MFYLLFAEMFTLFYREKYRWQNFIFLHGEKNIQNKQTFTQGTVSIFTFVYQRVRNVSFSDNFANVLNEWSL